jgi:hypothetical protein
MDDEDDLRAKITRILKSWSFNDTLESAECVADEIMGLVSQEREDDRRSWVIDYETRQQ